MKNWIKNIFTLDILCIYIKSGSPDRFGQPAIQETSRFLKSMSKALKHFDMLMINQFRVQAQIRENIKFYL